MSYVVEFPRIDGRILLPTQVVVLTVAFAILCCGSGKVVAQLYWDANGSVAGSGNSGGVWSAAANNWSTSSSGTTTTQGWKNGSAVVFAAGNDANLTLKTITILGTVATPSISFDDVALFNFTGGSIDISGGSIFDTSILGSATDRSLNWSSAIIGEGNLTLNVHGDTSSTGGGSNSVFQLSGSNTFTGNILIGSGIVRSNSNFGDAINTITLNGGGIYDDGLNSNFSRGVFVGTAGGVYRTSSTVSTGQFSGALTGGGIFRRTEAGMLLMSGNGAGFSGTIRNENAAATSITAMNADWSNTAFVHDEGATTAAIFRFGGTSGGSNLGTARIHSLHSRSNVEINNGTILDVVSGNIQMSTRAHSILTGGGGRGRLTSSSGTLSITNGTTGPGNLESLVHTISSLVQDHESGPLTVVKNGRATLAFLNSQTFSGGLVVNEGRVRAGGGGSINPLGVGTVTVANGGQVHLQGGFVDINNDFIISGEGVLENGIGTGALLLDGGTRILGDIALAGHSRITVQNSAGPQNASVTMSGNLSGSSNLELIGPNTLTFFGEGSEMTGDINIRSGRLNFIRTLGGNVKVDDGAALGWEGAIAGNLTLGSATHSTLFISPINTRTFEVGGNLAVNGVVTVELETPLTTSSTTVVNFDGQTTATSANFQLAGGANYRSPIFSVHPHAVELTIDQRSLVWTGASSALWVTGGGQLNWKDPNPQNFYWADSVLFDDSATNNFNITLASQVSPSAIGVNSDVNSYTLNSTTTNQISGTGILSKEGSSVLQMNGPNTYTGGTVLKAGTILFNNNTSLGSGTILLDEGNANLLGSGPVVLGNAIQVAKGNQSPRIGSSPASSGEIRFNGTITLDQRDATIFAGSSGTTTISGQITGTGNIRIEAADAANNRDLVLFSNLATGISSQNNFIGDVTIGANARLRLSGSVNRNIPDASTLYFDNSGSRLEVAASAFETLGTLVSSVQNAGVIESLAGTGSTTLRVGGDSENGTFSGMIRFQNNTAALNIHKVGLGNQVFSGFNSYSGSTLVANGTLTVDGVHANSTTQIFPYNVSASATLAGTGSIQATVNVDANGVLSSGNELLRFESLHINSLSMASQSVFKWETFDNSHHGADLVKVNGNLNLNGAVLELSLANLGESSWNIGDKLTLLSYTGNLTGTGFVGFIDDTAYTFGDNQWTINYNDTSPGTNFISEATGSRHVTLTLTAVPEPASWFLLFVSGLVLAGRRNKCHI